MVDTEKWKKWREEKVKDIKEHPENHKHDFGGLQMCCWYEGSIDLQLMDMHSEHVDLGRNGGVKCDVTEGPCACGAWH